jgi:hypothetical protein
MTAKARRQGRATGLMDRRAECDVLGRLVDPIRAGQSRVLVVRGDPGVGKAAPDADALGNRKPAEGCGR